MKNKNILPKCITISEFGKYRVIVYSKKYKTKKFIGDFICLKQAVNERDKFIVDNYHDFTDGFTPRGISKVTGGYRASFSYAATYHYIGTFKSIYEAIENRNEFVESLK